MKLTMLFLLITCSLLAQPNESLFNGKDISGWTVHGTEKWYAKNGELICENGPDKKYGYFSTNKSYKNFILTLEFNQETNGNSGVFFRSSIDTLKISGWQVEVAPLNHNTGGLYESYGRGWLIKPKPEDESFLKPAEWNVLKIKVVGDEVTTWLNGHQMVYLKDEKIGLGEGFIALQIHEGSDVKVRWRNIKIKQLK